MAHEGTRFYENEFPEPNELVVVKVARLEANMGAYVQLLEYGNMEGLILPSELSKRRFRSITKLVRVGRQEVVMVVRVDPEKGYVDLSKKRVAPEDIASAEERFSNSKKVYLTARQVASQLKVDVMELNRIAIWPLYKKYGHAYQGLLEAADDPDKAFEGIDCSKEIINALVEDVKGRMAPQQLRIRARLQVSCTGEKGVEAVKEALMSVKDMGSMAFELSTHLVASPLYSVIATCTDRIAGLAKMEEVCKAIREKIESFPGGEFSQQGQIVIFGGEEHEKGEESEEASESESESEEEDEEDEGMYHAEDVSDEEDGQENNKEAEA